MIHAAAPIDHQSDASLRRIAASTRYDADAAKRELDRRAAVVAHQNRLSADIRTLMELGYYRTPCECGANPAAMIGHTQECADIARASLRGDVPSVPTCPIHGASCPTWARLGA